MHAHAPGRKQLFFIVDIAWAVWSGEEALPDYLKGQASAALCAQEGTLRILETDLCAFLRTQPDSSADKLYLSNVGEWLSDGDLCDFSTRWPRSAGGRNRVLSCFDGRPALTRVGEVAIRRNPAESANTRRVTARSST